MATRSGAVSIGMQAIQATARGAGVIIPLALVYGVVLTGLDLLIYRSAMPNGQMPGQEDLIRVLLPWAGATLGLEIVLGPIVGACAVFLGRSFVQNSAISLYKAINFALNRYGRMFVPHLAAQISIQLGLIIIIPGILFQLQYAFVDSVASMEDEKSVLNRSKRLTRSRRRTVFLLFLPWLLLSQGIVFVDLWALGQSPVHLFAVKTVSFIIYFVMQVSFFLLYNERTQRRPSKQTS